MDKILFYIIIIFPLKKDQEEIVFDKVEVKEKEMHTQVLIISDKKWISSIILKEISKQINLFALFLKLLWPILISKEI